MAHPAREEASSELSATESTLAPEYWVARPELPYSREYVAFQVAVVREIANRLKVPMSTIVDDYAPIFHPYIWPDTDTFIPIDEMTDEEITSAIHQKEIEHVATLPLNTYSGIGRYGCFSYFAHTGGTGEERKGSVDIHFANAELDDTGPLDKEKIEHRLRELKDLFTDIKKEYPEAKSVRGDSWLYNIDAYKRLFPDSYTADPKVDTTEGVTVSGRIWGQFCNSKRGLKEDLANNFLNAIRALDEITPETVRKVFPHQALIVEAPIADFYEKYGVE